ncbi:MAG: hypothetical protein IPM35_02520 [Myxococcales bacterium]|nr:hypothetical protein [Myxococcales bacterium]
MQKRVDPSMCGVGDDTIYGLRSGFEDAIDYVLESAGDVPAAQLSAMGTLLDEHFMDPVKLAAFKGSTTSSTTSEARHRPRPGD